MFDKIRNRHTITRHEGMIVFMVIACIREDILAIFALEWYVTSNNLMKIVLY